MPVRGRFDANDLPATLTKSEESELAACEEIIKRGWRSFVAVGLALARIRDKHLYRKAHATFQAYCLTQWQFGRFYAYRLIGAAQVVEHLLTIVNIPQPVNEAQVRPLMGLTTRQAETAWKKAVESANGKRITANLVRKAAAEFRKRSPRRDGQGKFRRKMILDLIGQAQSALTDEGNTEKAIALLARLKRTLATEGDWHPLSLFRNEDT